VIYIAAVIDFILGVLLCYYGFKRKWVRFTNLHIESLRDGNLLLEKIFL
jgi:hypothetical protein